MLVEAGSILVITRSKAPKLKSFSSSSTLCSLVFLSSSSIKLLLARVPAPLPALDMPPLEAARASGAFLAGAPFLAGAAAAAFSSSSLRLASASSSSLLFFSSSSFLSFSSSLAEKVFGQSAIF